MIKPGGKAPPFVLNRGENTIQGIGIPYLNKIVLLHFWNSNLSSARTDNLHLKRILEKYSDSDFINAEGFEIISIAVQNNQQLWNEAIQKDSLYNFIHGIALKGFTEEDVCQKFGISQVPTNILIDETGEVVMVNPRMADLENYLDDKKNVHPLKKDIYGIFALSSSFEDKMRFSKVYLFNHYGDSLAYTRTNENGLFVFHDLKLNQDLVLKLNNQLNIITSDPTALYNTNNEVMMKGKTHEGGFVFELSSKLISKLQLADSSVNTVSPIEISITKYLDLKSSGISANDEKELKGIISILAKNQKSIVEIAVHTNNKQDEKTSKNLSDSQGQLLKTYFVKNGITQNRIRVLSFGSTQPAVVCLSPCSEEVHKKNKRVEFTILKN